MIADQPGAHLESPLVIASDGDLPVIATQRLATQSARVHTEDSVFLPHSGCLRPNPVSVRSRSALHVRSAEILPGESVLGTGFIMGALRSW